MCAMNKFTLRNNSVILWAGLMLFSLLPVNSLGAESERSMEDTWLQQQRAESGLVGMAAIVIQGGEVRYPGSAGERKKGSGVSVTMDDRWHIGSVTKSMTATVLAGLVEAGEIDWDAPLLLVLVPEQDAVVANVYNDGNIERVDAIAWQWVEQSLQWLVE